MNQFDDIAPVEMNGAEQKHSQLNYKKSKQRIGYIPRSQADKETYQALGFKCGLEIHQQLKTSKKLFCRCPAGIYQRGDDYDAEIIRHMRPTLSEMGEYDGTALMERKTRKKIIYRIKNKTACTYEIDDTPPFKINQEALDITIEVALLLKTSIVGELHITRKQYLDGSIPTGFQRTAIVGIEGVIPLRNKKVGIIQISIEEDACREVSDIGHVRIYTTDRLGMPLLEMVTHPDMLTPDEAAEAGQYLRFLARSTGKVRTGIGAARQDVNVSVTGGTRVEIKGVAHIKWIPELTHNEAYRQRALLEIKDILNERVEKPSEWEISTIDIDPRSYGIDLLDPDGYELTPDRVVVVNLPHFKDILSFFTQPGKVFANELSDRLKVIACLERPNLIHSEMEEHPEVRTIIWDSIKDQLEATDDDAQLIVWGNKQDIQTALETIEERCLMAFEGVPNETRKSLPDGTTIFERVLPGPDRMYPDTDSAPIPITQERIEAIQRALPPDVSVRMKQLDDWKVPADCYSYILRRDLVPLMERIINDYQAVPSFVGSVLGHTMKNIEGTLPLPADFDYEIIYRLWGFVYEQKLQPDIIKQILPIVCSYPEKDFPTILQDTGYKKRSMKELLERVPELAKEFGPICTSSKREAVIDWIMGQLHRDAVGNVSLKELRENITKAVRYD